MTTSVLALAEDASRRRTSPTRKRAFSVASTCTSTGRTNTTVPWQVAGGGELASVGVGECDGPPGGAEGDDEVVETALEEGVRRLDDGRRGAHVLEDD